MRTGESVWEPPTRDFPEVVLSREVRKNSRKIQREYRRRIREEERASGIAEPDFLGGLFGGTPEKVVVKEPEPEPVVEVKTGFFDSIFGGADTAKPVVAQTEPLIEKEKSQPSPSFDLGSLFGGSGAAPKDEEGETLNINNIQSLDEDEEEEIETSSPSFGLGNMFKSSSKEDEAEDEDEEPDAGESLNLADFGKTVAQEAPKPKSTKSKTPAFSNPFSPKAPAGPPLTLDTSSLVLPSFDLGSLFGGSGSAPKDEEEGETLNMNNIQSVDEEEEIEEKSSFGLGNMFKGSSNQKDEDEDDEEPDAGESLNLADFGKTVAQEAPKQSSTKSKSKTPAFSNPFSPKAPAGPPQHSIPPAWYSGESLNLADFGKTVAQEAPKPKSTKSKTPAFSNPFSPKAPAGPPLTLDTSSLVLPHPEKVQWGGEDAIFVKERTFGVFDGVSGAEKLDGVPLYSKTMSEQMDIMVDDTMDLEEGLTLKQLERTMLEAAEYADGEATGATTGIVASVGKDNVLRALNVGDSGLLVIRDSKILSRSKDIVHYFDCPYQLAFDSPDRPRDGTKLTVNLQSQDLILMATDGIFDNLSDDLVLEISDESSSTDKLVQRIVDESRRISLDDEAPTPYAKQAKNAKYEGFEDGLGGKVDDISCIAIRCT
eukprot:CAMPEP_0194445048 /NCGR_PEP_ID=MMETSP0176-20130528/127625_1 /TAXON_ID=216777 /ORGANISM="Proboscia alata, Strain PI-D3" /LENGTH=651 /DNA_ID=CAMNT_0039271537 /DNA_START=468 /DNA_END=2424 /DNA_ORIENTATION=+